MNKLLEFLGWSKTDIESMTNFELIKLTSFVVIFVLLIPLVLISFILITPFLIISYIVGKHI